MAIFKGAGVAIVTPMNEDGSVNYEKFGELIEFQIANGTDAIIICGTTGESSTLTHEEHQDTINYCVDKVAKRIPVVAGTGSNCTETAVYLSQEAEKYGVLPMFYLELSSGLRRGELLALQWSDLNVKERILTVNKQVTRMEGELDVTEPKTKNSVRKVALSQQAVDLLVQEHEQHPDNPILFPSPRTGGYWSPDAVSRINRKLLKNAGIEEHVRFHDLRHTFATMAISSGVDVKTLSSMLGHYSAGFTLDTYTHITNDMQRGAAEKIGGFMESATATPTPEPPDPPEKSRCKVIPFEKV